MFNLSKKELLIIKYLLDSKEYLSSDVLATLIGSNSRSVREYIKNISAFLDAFTIRIETKTGFGYHLEWDDYGEYYTFATVFRSKYPDESFIPFYYSNRIDSIVRNILKENSIKSSDLIDKLYISKTTFNNEIKIVKNVFAKYHISIASGNHGYCINGQERHIRIMISDYLCYDESDDNEDASILNVTIDNNKVYNELLDGLVRYGIHVSFLSFDEICNLIVASMARFKSGHNLTLDDDEISEIESLEDYQTLDKIVLNIWPDAPKVERDAIVLYIQSRRIYGINDNFNRAKNKDLSNLFSRIRTFIASLSSSRLILGSDLEELIPRVLKGLLIRVKYGYETRKCPIIDEKKKNIAFSLATLICYFISRDTGYNISEIEIAEFARELNSPLTEAIRNAYIQKKTVCVISSSGKNSGLLFKQKLERDYSEYIKVIELKEFYEINQNNCDFDLLITDVPKSKFCLDVEIFQTKFNLGPREHIRVVNLLNDKKKKVDILFDSFDEDLYFPSMDYENKDELLNDICHKIEKKIGCNRVYNHICFQENLVSGEIGNAMAVCNTIFALIENPKISIVTLKRPIIWKNEYVSVVLIVTLGYSGNLQYNIIRELSLLYNEPMLAHKICYSVSFNETIKLIKDSYLQKTMF